MCPESVKWKFSLFLLRSLLAQRRRVDDDAFSISTAWMRKISQFWLSQLSGLSICTACTLIVPPCIVIYEGSTSFRFTALECTLALIPFRAGPEHPQCQDVRFSHRRADFLARWQHKQHIAARRCPRASRFTPLHLANGASPREHRGWRQLTHRKLILRRTRNYCGQQSSPLTPIRAFVGHRNTYESGGRLVSHLIALLISQIARIAARDLANTHENRAQKSRTCVDIEFVELLLFWSSLQWIFFLSLPYLYPESCIVEIFTPTIRKIYFIDKNISQRVGRRAEAQRDSRLFRQTCLETSLEFSFFLLRQQWSGYRRKKKLLHTP